MIKIFAHRGASKEAPENSLEAFRRAIEIGADGIELDCVLTKDKVPVVTHDPKDIHKKTWEEVEPLGIPNLTEVLELIKPSEAQIIFDIKAQPGMMMAGPLVVAGLAQEIIPANRILLSSFYFRHLLALKKHFPHLTRALILSRSVFRLVPIKIFGRFFGVKAIHPLLTWITEPLVKHWQSKGYQVHAWVANTEAELARCKQLGVDGVFTDDPRFAKNILEGE